MRPKHKRHNKHKLKNHHQSIANASSEISAVVIMSPPTEPETRLVPYDENLLERSRTQWQFGDWESLVLLSRDTLQHHPDRAKLALLAAAGHLQTGDSTTARQFVRLAQDWGCSKKLISQILVAGVHNSLGRAAAIAQNENKSLFHFTAAIQGGGGDECLLSQARSIREVTRLGLLNQAAAMLKQKLEDVKIYSKFNASSAIEPRITMLQTEVDLLHHELSLAQQRQQLYGVKSDEEFNTEKECGLHNSSWLDALRKKSVSQLGQDLWVLEKTGYKRGGFFVEFGATDGVLLSNTWLLEKEFGWQGVCAEPNIKFLNQLQKNRSCILSDQCISGKTGKQVEFILADAYSGSKEYLEDDQHSKKRAAYLLAGHVIKLTTISLDDFLEQHGAPKKIDYLSVDTEGSEFEILQSFPFDKWDIKLLTIEHNFTNRRADIRSLLASYGYCCTEAQWDDWYEKG